MLQESYRKGLRKRYHIKILHLYLDFVWFDFEIGPDKFVCIWIAQNI